MKQPQADHQRKGKDLQSRDERLEGPAALYRAKVHAHKNEYKRDGDQLQNQAMHRNKECQVVYDCQRHDGNRRRIRGPEADPAAQESKRAGTGFTEVYILAAVLRICGRQFRVNKVCGNLEQAADDKGQNQKQAASGGVRHLGQRGKDPGTYGCPYAERDDRA